MEVAVTVITDEALIVARELAAEQYRLGKTLYSGLLVYKGLYILVNHDRLAQISKSQYILVMANSRVIRKPLVKKSIYFGKVKIGWYRKSKSQYIPKSIYTSKPLYAAQSHFNSLRLLVCAQ